MKAQVLKLLRESAEWRLISLLFEPPQGGWHRHATSLAAEVDDTTLNAAVVKAATQATESLYHSTFGPGGPAAPREVSYQGQVLAGQVLGEVTGYYQAFAYDPILSETPDHVAVEAGFVSYLRLKEAYALEREDSDQAQVCADAARQFIADHLNALAEPLSTSLQASGIPYLSDAAAALLQRVGARRSMPSLSDVNEASCPEASGCSWADDAS